MAKKPSTQAVETELTVTFIIERETKMTKRFSEEPGDDGVIQVGTLYVQRSALAKIGNPDALEVIIRPINVSE